MGLVGRGDAVDASPTVSTGTPLRVSSAQEEADPDDTADEAAMAAAAAAEEEAAAAKARAVPEPASQPAPPSEDQDGGLFDLD